MLAPAVGIFLFGCLFIEFYAEVFMAVIERAPCTCDKLACQADALAVGGSQKPCDTCCFANERYPRQLDTYFLPPAPACLVSMLLGYPTAMAWYFSMKVCGPPLPFLAFHFDNSSDYFGQPRDPD